ncbi:hypothetical protein ACJJTC_016486 [Scirpophaga incertulas]
MENQGVFRKRKRKEKKENVIKMKKAKGLEHLNYKNKLVPAREVGPDCRCKVYKCYDKIDAEQRQIILKNFNALGNNNDQNAYLMSLISSSHPKRHTSERPQKFRMVTYSFKIRVRVEEIPVCLTAFCSIHGVKKGRIRRLQGLITVNVLSPKDVRGSHKSNRYKKTPEEILHLIRSHIESFRTRQSITLFSER